MMELSLSTPTLADRDFILSPFREGDVSKQYQDWLMDPDVIRFLDVRHADRSMDALRAYVRDKENAANEYFFLVTAKDTGRKIGTINLSVYADRHTAHFGYLIGDQSYWGGNTVRGIKGLLLDFAFVELKLRYVGGGVSASNTASHFNYRRMGFRMEAVLRNCENDDQAGPADVLLYGMLRDEWLAQKTHSKNPISPARPALIIDDADFSIDEAAKMIVDHHRQSGWSRQALDKTAG